MRKLALATLLALAAATLAGCQTTDACQDCNAETGEAATLTAANESCPFSGKPVNASVQTVAFNGQEVGFCCAGCGSKFEAMSDEEKATQLAKQ